MITSLRWKDDDSAVKEGYYYRGSKFGSQDPQQVIWKHLQLQFYGIWQPTFGLQGISTDVQNNPSQTHI